LLLAVACLASVQLRADAAESKESEVAADGVPTVEAPEVLSGVVLDDQGKPITSAKVFLFLLNYNPAEKSQRQLQEVRTTEKGRFEFAEVDIQQVRDRHLTLQVIAQSPGRTSISHRVALDGVDEYVVNFTLPPAGAMEGRITDANGVPVAGAIVSANSCSLFEPIPGIGAAVTDADGRYEISDLNRFDLANQKPQPVVDGVGYWSGTSS
jgi:5-hydroxyisourate hydrolase-like protein (transthyretin family)